MFLNNDHDWFPATELQNCLAEALPAAVARRGPVIPTGSGDVEIRVTETVYCRATDAFAGNILTEVHRVHDRAAADAWIASRFNGGDGGEWDGISIEVIDPHAVTAPVHHADEDDGIPF